MPERDDQQQVGNKNGLTRSEVQAEVHQRALERAGERNQSHPAPTGAPLPTNDAQLNWAAGTHVASVGRGDVPFELAEVAGLSAEQIRSEEPFSNVRGVPDCSQGIMNMEGILGGKR